VPDAAKLLVRLMIAASPGERDLLLVLGLDGDTPERAAARLLTHAGFDTRLHRLRRRAERVIRD